MNSIFLAFSFLFASVSFSQKLIIHVFERQEIIFIGKATIDSAITYPDIVNNVDTSYTCYVIDLDEQISTYYEGSILTSTLPIIYEDYGNGILKINILQDGLDYGLVVNTNSETESVTWFWFLDDMTTVKKISKFVFEKSM
jgi:hypothetical protein